jgi:hypothetical protein
MRVALLSLFAACASAQLKFDIHPVIGRASDRLKETRRFLRIAQQSSMRDAAAPEEFALVEAIVRDYRLSFLPEINSVPKIATLTDRGSDILIASWPASNLIVWDSPDSMSFVFKLPPHRWSSDAAIRSTFEKLALPRTNGVTLNVASDAQTKRRIGAGELLIPRPPYQFDTGPLNWVDLWETADASYLCVTFSNFGIDKPFAMRWIPERFPPLEKRVRQWTKQQILDELNCLEPVNSDSTHPQNSLGQWDRKDQRDRVLARELMTRDPAEDDLHDLLLKRRPHENGELLQAVVDAGKVALFQNAVRDYLRGDHGEGNVMTLWRPAFEIVNRARDANFTDAALDVLRREAPAEGAFAYAAQHGETPADYLALRQLPPLLDGFMPNRNRVLADMRVRLGLDEEGNPITAK